MTQVVQLLIQEGPLAPESTMEHQSWSIRIPVGVHEAIGRRLDRLSEGCNQVLTTASVVGREFEMRLLELLMPELTDTELLDAVEEALVAGIIEELPQAVSRYQFAHVLIQNTLSRELSAARRARLHSRAAESLEALYKGNPDSHAVELAYYFAEAGTGAGTEKMVHYSLLAGERALTTYAHEQALDYFQRGIEAKEGQPVDSETAALLFGLGRAQVATFHRHQMYEAEASLTAAFDFYTKAGDVARSVAVATYPFPITSGRIPGMVE